MAKCGDFQESKLCISALVCNPLKVAGSETTKSQSFEETGFLF
jgi:hypothetical protein